MLTTPQVHEAKAEDKATRSTRPRPRPTLRRPRPKLHYF